MKMLDNIILFLICTAVIGLTFSNTFSEAGVGLSILFWLIKKIKDRHIEKVSIHIFLFFYLLTILLSFINSSYFLESYRGFLRNLKYILFFLVVVEISKNPKHLKKILASIVFASFLMIIDGLYQMSSYVDFLRGRKINTLDYLLRVSASFVHANDFGAYIITVFPVIFSLAIILENKKLRYFLLSFLPLLFFLLIRTFSRGAWLGFLIGVSFFLFFYRRKLSFILPILFLIALLFISSKSLGRIGSFLNFKEGTVWERMELWKGTLSMIREHPIIGFGINTYSRNFPNYKPKEYPDIRYAHNCYLQMASEIGILGLLAFLGIIVKTFIEALKVIRKRQILLLGFLSGILAFLVQSNFDTHLYSLVLLTMFWIHLAIIHSFILNSRLNVSL